MSEGGLGERLWRRLPGVRRPERERFVFFLTLTSLLSASQTLGLAGSEALLLGREGAAVLPMAFIAASLATLVLSFVYASLVGSLRNDGLFAALLGLAALLLVGCAAAAWLELGWAPRTIFCLYFVTQAILLNHFWTFAGDHFDTLASKRVFPLFALGASAGGALGGGVAAAVSRLGPTELLIAGWATGLALAALLLSAARGRLRSWGPLHEHEEADETSVEGVRAALRFARGSAISRWLVLSALGMVIALFVSQYLYSEVFARRFPEPETLAAFFGVFLLAGNLIEIALELAVTPRLISRFGLAGANLVHPVLTFASFGALALDFRLPSAMAARLNREVLENALAAPVRNLVYNALPLRLRGRMRALLEGVVVYSGMTVAGVLLLVLGRPDPRLLCGLGVGMAALYLLSNLRVQRAYLAALVEQLRAGRLDLRDVREGIGSLEVQALSRLWRELVTAETGEPARGVLDLAPLLAAEGQLEPLYAAAEHPHPSVRARVVEALAGVGDERARSLRVAAAADPEPAVRRLAVAALGADPEGRAALRERLADPDPAVRAEAARALGSEGAAELERMLRGEDPEAARAALERLPAALSPLAALRVRDPLPALRTAALECCARHARSEDLDDAQLRACLDDPHPAVRRALLEAVGHDARVGVQRLARFLADPDGPVRAAAVAALAERGDDGVAEATRMLGSSRSTEAEAAVAVCGAVGSDSARRRLLDEFRRRVLLAWDHLLALQALAACEERDARLLHAAHGDGLRRDARLAFRILGALEGPKLLRRVTRALRIGRPADRGEALEVLSNLGDREAAALLTLMHEPGPLEDRIRGIHRFADRPRTPEQVLERSRGTEERWLSLAVRSALGEAPQEEQEMMERLIALRRVPLFHHLALDQLEAIGRAMKDETYLKGEVVVQEGEPGNSLYLILQGEVVIYSGYGTPQQEELNRLRAPQYLGEMAVLLDEQRTATAVVSEDALLATLGGERLKELVLDMPVISFEILRQLAQRVRNAERQRATPRPA